ncbi:MAG: TIR domain-containing protein [Lachnospiraceae bacterium]|nr:TIR domain-containing protein [Lachnospiraceae bacterium]
MQTVLECKQCGASLDVEEGQKIVYCKYCGSANAVSYADRFGLYNRANYLRRQNEFDRAIGVYEDILNGDPHDAEAHYGIALCKYGIEYVDDPHTGKKIPTCHRTRYTLMSQDVDFKKAVADADADTARLYQEEASRIDDILRKIQQLSSKQEKYDIFICYKEGDGTGGRTQTSVLAQQIYQRLEDRGYKVFFARKTLEKKLGSEYEPIIFAALFSAKVMLAVGTKPEEFQGVWVRNEWTRFRERMEAGEECTLIPLYRDMSPYDLPEEFISLQALDMGKIGFEQDLLDGLAKLIRRTESVKERVVELSTDNASLKKRAYLFLECGDFRNAATYFERVLDNDPEDAEAYFGKLLLELGCRQESDMNEVVVPILERQNYQMAVRFAKGELLERYQGYAESIEARVAELRQKEEEERVRREREEQEERERREREEQEERERREREEQEEKERREAEKKQRAKERKAKRKRFWKIARRGVLVVVLLLLLNRVRMRLTVPMSLAREDYLSAENFLRSREDKDELLDHIIDIFWNDFIFYYDFGLYLSENKIDELLYGYSEWSLDMEMLDREKEYTKSEEEWAQLDLSVELPIRYYRITAGITSDGEFVYKYGDDEYSSFYAAMYLANLRKLAKSGKFLPGQMAGYGRVICCITDDGRLAVTGDDVDRSSDKYVRTDRYQWDLDWKDLVEVSVYRDDAVVALRSDGEIYGYIPQYRISLDMSGISWEDIRSGESIRLLNDRIYESEQAYYEEMREK